MHVHIHVCLIHDLLPDQLLENILQGDDAQRSTLVDSTGTYWRLA
jgi:hypothetical protein